MRIKKGFTLAEILIVLMVIGVIATMTVPSLMKGVNEAQFKTAYKKAFNAVTNIAAVEKISGQLPVGATQTSAVNFFSSLNSNLSVKEYAAPWGDLTSAQEVVDAGTTYTKVTFAGSTFGNQNAADTNKYTGGTSLSANAFSPWIVTEDGLAYAVTYPSGGTCKTKAEITEQTTAANAYTASCVIVMVDVNGLSKGPNKLEPQVGASAGVSMVSISSANKLNQLEGDRYYILVGNDGVSAGPKAYTVSGRLMADMK